MVVALDVSENGAAAHDGSVEQTIEVFEVDDADFEGTGMLELLRRAFQPGVDISNDAFEFVLGHDHWPRRLFGQRCGQRCCSLLRGCRPGGLERQACAES